MTLKLSQNQKLELKKTMKLDIVQIYVQTPKTVLIPYPDPKNSPLGIKKPNTTPKLSKNQVRIEGSVEIKSCSTT